MRDERAAEVLEHAPRMFSGAAESEVIQHRALEREVRRAVYPHIGLAGLAAPGRQQRDRPHLSHSVGVDHVVAEDEGLQRLGQRLQAHAADVHPLRHARARDVNARERVDIRLTLQRQMVVVLGEHHLREQARRRDTLGDDLCGRRRGLNGLAARTGVFATDVAQHKELCRHAALLLTDLLADAVEGLAAGAMRRLDFVVTINAWQARWQCLA